MNTPNGDRTYRELCEWKRDHPDAVKAWMETGLKRWSILVSVGFNAPKELHAFSDTALLAINGLGQATVDAINAWKRAHPLERAPLPTKPLPKYAVDPETDMTVPQVSQWLLHEMRGPKEEVSFDDVMRALVPKLKEMATTGNYKEMGRAARIINQWERLNSARYVAKMGYLSKALEAYVQNEMVKQQAAAAVSGADEAGSVPTSAMNAFVHKAFATEAPASDE